MDFSECNKNGGGTPLAGSTAILDVLSVLRTFRECFIHMLVNIVYILI